MKTKAGTAQWARMTFLPIVARELRVAARRRAAYWNRVLAALLALGLGTLVYVNFHGRGAAELGLALFVSLAWLAFVFCALAGARLTADAVSEERREGTLGLLFLTDLKGHDVVLGKLAASSVSAFYSLLAIVPILGMALLFGGVSGTQFGRTVLVLVNTMLFSLALGLCISTAFENGRRAAGVTVLALLVVCLGPWLVVAAIEASGKGGGQQQEAVLLAPSPALALAMAAIPGAPGFLTRLFWPSVATTFGLTVVCLAVSSLVVPRVWHDRPVTARRLRWRRWREGQVFGAGGLRRAFRERLLAVNPFFWLTSRDRLRPLYVWTLLAAAALVWLWGRLTFGRDWEDPGVLLMFSQSLYGLLKLWIAAAAVVRLAEDRRSAALELLLTTPLDVGEIQNGLRRSLSRQFLGPLLALVVLDVFFCWLAMHQFYSDREMMFWTCAARVSLLGMDVLTLWALGPWVAVTVRHANQAAANLLIRVCVLPWLAFLVLVFLAALVSEWRGRTGGSFEFTEHTALWTWFVLGLANDLFWLAYARVKMRQHFREAAAARFESKGGWWRALWRLR